MILLDLAAELGTSTYVLEEIAKQNSITPRKPWDDITSSEARAIREAFTIVFPVKPSTF